MAWFSLKYYCEDCDIEWDDEWSCECDSSCPECGSDYSPKDSTDLTFEFNTEEDGQVTVSISPETAEISPQYEEKGTFPNMVDAKLFAISQGWDLDEG